MNNLKLTYYNLLIQTSFTVYTVYYSLYANMDNYLSSTVSKKEQNLDIVRKAYFIHSRKADVRDVYDLSPEVNLS